MTDRVKGFVVSLEKDVRIDDVKYIQNAIRIIKGVCDVSPSISTHEDEMNRMRINSELRDKFYQFMKDNF